MAKTYRALLIGPCLGQDAVHELITEPLEPGVDYSNEPTTLITFRLAEAPGGILLTVTESGFDKIPRRFVTR